MNTTAVAEAPIDITHDDIQEAYLISHLRYNKISLVKALGSPAIYKALRNTAIAIKKKRQAENPLEVDIRSYSVRTPGNVEEAFANIEVLLDGMDQQSIDGPAFIIATNIAYLRGYLRDIQ